MAKRDIGSLEPIGAPFEEEKEEVKQEEEPGEKWVQVATRVPESLRQAFRLWSVSKGISMQDACHDWLKKLMEDEGFY